MLTNMDYSNADDWILGERAFDSNTLGKCEAVMCLGNGYMGMRSVTEERYLKEKRNLFVAGTFNQFDESEVTELPNAADLIGIEIEFDGHRFDLEKGQVKSYYRQLNVRTGELKREVRWTSPAGAEIELAFYRIISMKRMHVLAQRVEIRSRNKPVHIKISSGIDGQVTNSGAQHFIEGAKRLHEEKYMEYLAKTSSSNIDFVFHTCLNFWENGVNTKPDSMIVMDRRQIFNVYEMTAGQDVQLAIEKISTVFTSRDKQWEEKELRELRQAALTEIKDAAAAGYQKLLEESADEWEQLVWKQASFLIQSRNPKDQLAVRFAQYHLYIMAPRHDNRMHIGAKGLSGEGYKGHTFWDTEIFVLPYFTFTNPAIAKSLVEYRYLSLSGAHEKAKCNHYQGAQFPWESAWLDDGEVTPVWGAADIITGLPTKIWSGFIEQHITADVAYGVWQYYMVTGDHEFMENCGYELILDTAKFWTSRLEWEEADAKYHINDVVGPDEYKEHIDDNAFTNYMAHWNIKLALQYARELSKNDPALYNRLNQKLNLVQAEKEWEEKLPQIFLPLPREGSKVIAQNATYLDLKEIDLKKYKNQKQVGTIFKDYNLDQVNEIQVSKQADLMILFFLMENLFSNDVKKANWDYYEPRTLHDSSLSLSTHCILANDLGQSELAYELFQRACEIDMGEDMKSSDPGIHAASIGGIWQCAVFGFGGIRMLNGQLRVQPNLPEAWDKLSFTISWQGEELQICIDHEQVVIENKSGKKELEIEIAGAAYTLVDQLKVSLESK